MIGVSLPYMWFSQPNSRPISFDKLFPLLQAHDVESCELRTVEPDADPCTVRRAVDILWNYGFSVTIHSRVRNLETAVAGVFDPLAQVLPRLRQKKLTLTIHPLPAENVSMLTALSDYAMEHRFPVQIALENNRLLPDGTQGDSTALVLEAVQQADRDNVGICFDFGHYAYYRKVNHPDKPFALPPKEFFRRVVHTHIHAMNDLQTHFPLDRYPLPLREMLMAIDFEYYGVYNIELEFKRFSDDPVDSLLSSADTLGENLGLCAGMYRDLQQNFDRQFLSAAAVLHETAPGCRFGLIKSSAYLFNTNGCV